MRIWLVSPAWRRFAITRLCLAQRRWLCDELAARGHEAHSVIVADDDNLDVAREYGFDTVELGNDDLGAKFNTGYKYAARRGADVFVHVGSDDWIHPSVFDVLDEMDLAATAEPDFIPPEGIVWRRTQTAVSQTTISLADLETGTLQRCRVRGRWGCIPWLIPRATLEAVNFAPIPLGRNRGIDGALARGLLTRPNWLVREVPVDSLVDFKSETNLTPYELIAANLAEGAPASIRALEDSYPSFLVGMAESMAKVAA